MTMHRESSEEDAATDATPLISVVIATFDREPRMLGAAIESVLDQGIGSLEVVVVDDGSTPPAEAVVASYGSTVRYHHKPHSGCGATRNHGVALSRGELLAFLDSDDVWVPGKLQRQLARLEAEPGLEAVFGWAEQFYDEELDEEFRRRHPIKDVRIEAWLSSAMLIRRAAYDRVGGYEEAAVGAADLDWFLRAREAGLRCELLPDVVYRRRVHTTNLSVVHRSAANTERLIALKRGLDRRRAAEGSSG